MEKFELKILYKKALIPLALIILALYGASIFVFPSTDMEASVIIRGAIAMAILFILKNFLKKKRTLKVTDTDVVLEKRGHIVAQTAISKIAMIKVSGDSDSATITIYSVDQQKPIIQFEIAPKNDLENEISSKIAERGNFVQNNLSDKYGIHWVEYINKEVVRTDAQPINKIRINEKQIYRTIIIGGAVVTVLLLTVSLLPFFINPKKFYDWKDNKLYYGSDEVIGINTDQVKLLSYSVVKDSVHVFYKGNILEWADAQTFVCLRDPFYADKNGVYHERLALYLPNKIQPLSGAYDAETFQTLGYNSLYYKDKNHIYRFDTDLMGDNDNPLVVADIEGLDPKSFEQQSFNWYTDKNRVYFATFSKIENCPEIDRKTFKLLTYRIVKDTNHVYYLTHYLETEGERKIEDTGYAILEGADAPSFEKIDDETFVDKNKKWTIRKLGEYQKKRTDI